MAARALKPQVKVRKSTVVAGAKAHPTELTTLQKSDAVDQVRGGNHRSPPLILSTIQRLLRDILTGVYGPGDRIREAEVAERFGISRAPVREALRVLEQDGMVVMAPFRGASVIDPTPEQIADVFDLLGTLYGAVAKLAVRHASDADLKRFSGDVALFVKAVEQGRDGFYLVDIAYRIGTDLGQSCGSPIAAEMLRRVGRIAYWLHRYMLPVPRLWQRQGAIRFRKFEAALLARSEDRSELAARKLVRHTRDLVMQHALEALQQTSASPITSSPLRRHAARRDAKTGKKTLRGANSGDK